MSSSLYRCFPFNSKTLLKALQPESIPVPPNVFFHLNWACFLSARIQLRLSATKHKTSFQDKFDRHFQRKFQAARVKDQTWKQEKDRDSIYPAGGLRNERKDQRNTFPFSFLEIYKFVSSLGRFRGEKVEGRWRFSNHRTMDSKSSLQKGKMEKNIIQ